MPTPSEPQPDRGRPAGDRFLVVMRHARAESFAEADHHRRLTERGRRDAEAAGRWLASADLVPSHALVSSALRAQETWQVVQESAASPAEAVVDGALYAGGPDSVLEAVRSVTADAAVVLYVGHNPTAASLAHVLDDGDPDPDALRALSTGFPPAAMAVLTVAAPWADLEVASARLVACHNPGD